MSLGDEDTNGKLSPEPNQPETSVEADSARQLRSASVSESPFSGFTLSLPEAFEHGVDQYDEVLARLVPPPPAPPHPYHPTLLAVGAHRCLTNSSCCRSDVQHPVHAVHVLKHTPVTHVPTFASCSPTYAQWHMCRSWSSRVRTCCKGRCRSSSWRSSGRRRRAGSCCGTS